MKFFIMTSKPNFYNVNKTADACSRVVWYVDYALKRMCYYHASYVFDLLDDRDTDPRIAIETISILLKLNISGSDIGKFRNFAFHGNVDPSELAKFMGIGIGIILKAASSINLANEETNFYTSEIDAQTFRRLEERKDEVKRLSKKLAVIKEERFSLFSNRIQFSSEIQMSQISSPSNFKLDENSSKLFNFEGESPIKEELPENLEIKRKREKKSMKILKERPVKSRGTKGKNIGLKMGHVDFDQHRIRTSDHILYYPKINFEVSDNKEIVNKALEIMCSLSKGSYKLKKKNDRFIVENMNSGEANDLNNFNLK